MDIDTIQFAANFRGHPKHSRTYWLCLVLLFVMTFSSARAFEPPAQDDVAKDQAEIRRLIDFLKNKGYYGLRDPEERKAIERLRSYGERAVPAVAELLAEGHRNRPAGWIEVFRPLYLLKGFGPAGKSALTDVTRALDDEHPINVGMAAEVLQDIGRDAKDAVPALLQAWEKSKKSPESTRTKLAAAIKQLDPEAATRAQIP
jgi:hypothetical protein